MIKYKRAIEARDKAGGSNDVHATTAEGPRSNRYASGNAAGTRKWRRSPLIESLHDEDFLREFSVDENEDEDEEGEEVVYPLSAIRSIIPALMSFPSSGQATDLEG